MSSESSPIASPAAADAAPPPSSNLASGGTGPSPLQIGKSFIKQYYKVLSTTPSQIHRFYQPDSAVSRGMEPSAPTTPSALSEVLTTVPANGEEGELVRKAFFDWAGKGMDELGEDAIDVLRIDFERGAIDAQESVGGGILLVVTGHMFLPNKLLTPWPFVHTFFLNNRAPPGRKRQFYVKNDVLRFLLPVVEGEVKEEPVVEMSKVEDVVLPVAPPAPPKSEPVAVVEEVVEEVAPEEVTLPTPELAEEPVVIPPEPTIAEEPEYAPPVEEEKVEIFDTPVAIVEETEQEPLMEEPTPEPVIEQEPAAEEEKIDLTEPAPPAIDTAAVSPTSDGKRGSGSKRNRRRRGGKSSRSNSPPNGAGETEEEAPTESTIKQENNVEREQPKKPTSWAGLVASGKAPSPKEDTAPISRKGSKSDRRGSPKSHRDDAHDKSPSNHDASAKAPPQSQQPRSGDRAPTTKESVMNASSSSPAAPQSQIIQSQRTPEATLFIRNIPDATKEPEIRALFEPFGVITGNKILGVTLNANRGFCFVDFDGPAAVEAVVTEAQNSLVKDSRTGRKVESSFMVHGRVLDVERKVQNERKQQGGMGSSGGSGGRRYNRSRSPKDGGGRYGSRGSRGSGMRRSPPRDGGRRTSGGGGGSSNR